MFSKKPTLTEDDRNLIILFQNHLIDTFRAAKGHLSEEEIAYTIKRAFDEEEIRLIENNL